MKHSCVIILKTFLPFLIFCATLPSHLFKVPHPLHVSTSDISFNSQTSKLETICTIFTDDFELALQKQFNSRVDLQKSDMHTAMDALVKKYIADHLQIIVNNQPVQQNYLGFQVNHEAIDVYIESGTIAVPKKVAVKVSILHNIFDDQINIVHITVNGLRKSGKINYPETNIEQLFWLCKRVDNYYVSTEDDLDLNGKSNKEKKNYKKGIQVLFELGSKKEDNFVSKHPTT